MKPFTSMILTTAVLAVSIAASPVRAQEETAKPAQNAGTPPAIEVTPFVSLDSRGSTPVGAAVTFPLNSSFSLETEVGYRRGEGHMNALSSSANLLYSLPRIGRVAPYLAGGAGLAQYGAPIVSPQGTLVGTSRRIAFEVNAGGGVKIPVSDTWGMRTDARWFKPLDRNAGEHWRVSHGVSFDTRK
jgi:hypothetical protein